jgi:hypothetical protein
MQLYVLAHQAGFAELRFMNFSIGLTTARIIYMYKDGVGDYGV